MNSDDKTYNFKNDISRASIILVSFIIGSIALRIFVINGTFADEKFKPVWMDEKEDLWEASNAIRHAEFEKAERILLSLLKKEPNYGAANKMIGYLYLQQDKFDLSLKHYRIAKMYHPPEDEIQKAIDLVLKRME